MQFTEEQRSRVLCALVSREFITRDQRIEIEVKVESGIRFDEASTGGKRPAVSPGCVSGGGELGS